MPTPTLPLRPLVWETDAAVRALATGAEQRRAFYDAAECPQWTLETAAREANAQTLADALAECRWRGLTT